MSNMKKKFTFPVLYCQAVKNYTILMYSDGKHYLSSYTMKKVEAMSFEEAMSFCESQIVLFTLTEDAKEGQKAFQEKRQPQWTGR